MNLNNISQIRYGGKDITLAKLNGDILYRKETEEPIDNPYYVEYTIEPANNTDVVSTKCASGAFYYRRYLPSVWGPTVNDDNSCHLIEITLKNGEITSDIDNTLAKDVASIKAYYDESVTQIAFVGWSDKDPNYLKELLHINTTKLTTYANLFFNTIKMTDIIPALDFSNITDTSRMFYNCKSLDALNNKFIWNTQNVTNMDSMFYGCEKLLLSYLGEWDVSSVTNMDSMFYGCKTYQHLASLVNLSKWDVSSVKNMNYMFCECGVGFSGMQNWNVSSLENSAGMFSGTYRGNCSISWNAPKLNNASRMYEDCNANELTITIDAPLLSDLSYFCYMSTVQYVDLCNCPITNASHAFSNCSNLSYVYSNSALYLTNSDYMFYNCTNLYQFPNFSYLEYCDYMFYGSGIGSFNMENITIGWNASFVSMFGSCPNLCEFYNNNWDYASYSLNANCMFKECTNLQYVYFENESITVNECSEMFYNCYNISEIKLTSFDTSNCYSYSDMFYSVYGSVYVGSSWTLNESDTGYSNSFIW